MEDAMARGDRGIARMKARIQADEVKKAALMKKGQEAGQRGKPKLTRREIKIARGMDKEQNG
jgi:hypothetical protein